MKVEYNKSKNTRKFIYKGTYEENIKKCKDEINKLGEKLEIARILKDRIDKSIESKLKRIEECKEFISMHADKCIPERDSEK